MLVRVKGNLIFQPPIFQGTFWLSGGGGVKVRTTINSIENMQCITTLSMRYEEGKTEPNCFSHKHNDNWDDKAWIAKSSANHSVIVKQCCDLIHQYTVWLRILKLAIMGIGVLNQPRVLPRH